MIPEAQSRADLHCHSTASEVSKLGIQRGAGLPECATPPDEVYELAKRRGMDFVTITDHDTIGGALEIADRPDAFLSEELTAWFRDEPQAVHVLCWGIDVEDHEWLQRNSGDLEACAEYLRENELACALAHPFYNVGAPLLARHRRRLAELFEVWETRNGSRARELNMPAEVYIETRGGTGVGGSDDHAGVDVGRTWTATPQASTPEEFLALIRTGEASADGDQGSAAKWAHAALALATRSLLADGALSAPPPSPAAVLRLAERVVSEGAGRASEDVSAFSSDEARGLLGAWLDSVDIASGEELIELMQAEGFSHAELRRRSRNAHDRKLAVAAASLGDRAAAIETEAPAALGALFESCLPVVPYVPAVSFLAGEKARLSGRFAETRRVALVVDAVGSTHGVSHTVERIRELGVPGFDVDVVGTDRGVDRRLPAVADVEVPFYEGLSVGVPSVPALVETLGEGRYDLIHVASPGPAGLAAVLVARIGGLPLVGSHHTELAAYAGLRSGNPAIEAAVRFALTLFYGQCEIVLSPSAAADESLRGVGIEDDRIERWGRGVDTVRFDPARRGPIDPTGAVNVLYAGRVSSEKGAELLAESFALAHERDPRLHLLIAGGGPEEEMVRERLGDTATGLGWLYGDELARTYASADAFLFCSATDTFGQVIVEAQASGLPVIAAAAGGPLELIDDGRTGLLREPVATELADALVDLAASPMLRRRLAHGGLLAARTRSWEAALRQLADGYTKALADPAIEPAPDRVKRAPAPLVHAA